MSYYIHNIPGRLRIRSAQIKRDNCQASNLCSILKSMTGIYSTELNKKGGSLIVHYDPAQLTADDILYTTHKAGCLEQVISKSRKPVSAVGTMLGNAIFGTVVKKSLETSMLSLVKLAVR
ncbi:hypothetical protein PN36_05700 [Candidatus Thiomargarita nelsonii]|uniref:HMA domain-containing protein n=1 Tax=Candidatus Thiomargarita nelsonii TaxID=1003181 RepID=A0A4E0QWY4_9GAMM|nr:hypothetical protein PN36_05700 [Candidatus Thiomargarita nelsonii]